MSALPPKADIEGRQFDVRFVPKGDKAHCSKSRLLDHLIGDRRELRKCQPKCFCRFEIKDQLELGRLMGQIRIFSDVRLTSLKPADGRNCQHSDKKIAGDSAEPITRGVNRVFKKAS